MRFFFFFLAVGFVISSCNTSPLEPAAGNYPGNIGTIIGSNCLGGNCHSGPDSLNTRFDLSTWDAMVKGSEYFNEIIPFNAIKSHFFGHINTNANLAPLISPTMPLARDPLSESDQIAFFNWIIQGAKSADGKIPYSDVLQKIFVVNQEENMISVIDAQTQRLVRILLNEGGGKPSAIAITPDYKSFIIAMQDPNGTVAKYDVKNYTKSGQFTTNLTLADVALNSGGTKGYLLDNSYGQNKICTFDPSSMNLTKTISSTLILQPSSIVIPSTGNYAYICGLGSDNILRLDMRSDSVIGCLPLGVDVPVPVTPSYISKYSPRKVVISSDSKTMYVTCQNTSEVVVFDLTKDSITARIPVPVLPWGEALTPDGSELWALAYGSNEINIISTATNQVIAEIDSVSEYPRAITFTPDGAYAFIACELSAGGVHHHVTGGLPPSSYVVVDRRARKVLSIEELPAVSVGLVTGYKN